MVSSVRLSCQSSHICWQIWRHHTFACQDIKHVHISLRFTEDLFSIVLLPWCLSCYNSAWPVPNNQEQRPRPFWLTSDWWNKRLTQGAQITLHPCLNQSNWHVEYRRSGIIRLPGRSYAVLSPPPPPVLRIQEFLYKFSWQWSTFLLASEEHVLLALVMLFTAFIWAPAFEKCSHC